MRPILHPAPWRALILLVVLTATTAGDELAPSAAGLADVPELLAVLRPAAEESTYLDIPWETDLWRARSRAAAEDKPILLWEMDGHPLGCT